MGYPPTLRGRVGCPGAEEQEHLRGVLVVAAAAQGACTTGTYGLLRGARIVPVRLGQGACAEGHPVAASAFFDLVVEMGGGPGEGGVSRARFPPGPHLCGSRFSRPPLRQETFRLCLVGFIQGWRPGPKHLFRLVARLISFRQATPS